MRNNAGIVACRARDDLREFWTLAARHTMKNFNGSDHFSLSLLRNLSLHFGEDNAYTLWTDGWTHGRSARTFSSRDTIGRTLSNIFTPVQQNCIPQAILGTDVLCQAKSGLGKTAVFVLSTLQQMEPVNGEVSVLILCHTRELAFQIKNEYIRFSKYMPEVRTEVFYGGTDIKENEKILKNKETHPHIIVATPGRLNALVREKKLRLGSVQRFVLDECDKMLDQIGMYNPNMIAYLAPGLIIYKTCAATSRKSSVPPQHRSRL